MAGGKIRAMGEQKILEPGTWRGLALGLMEPRTHKPGDSWRIAGVLRRVPGNTHDVRGDPEQDMGELCPRDSCCPGLGSDSALGSGRCTGRA